MYAVLFFVSLSVILYSCERHARLTGSTLLYEFHRSHRGLADKHRMSRLPAPHGSFEEGVVEECVVGERERVCLGVVATNLLVARVISCVHTVSVLQEVVFCIYFWV